MFLGAKRQLQVYILTYISRDSGNELISQPRLSGSQFCSSSPTEASLAVKTHNRWNRVSRHIGTKVDR